MTKARRWEVIKQRNSVTGQSRYLVVKGLITLTCKPTRRNPDPARALYGSFRKAERAARKMNRAERIDASWETQ